MSVENLLLPRVGPQASVTPDHSFTLHVPTSAPPLLANAVSFRRGRA